MAARLIYAIACSLDGYVSDAAGNFDWAAPDDEVHAFFNDLARPWSTYLLGRRMYETMRVWDHPEEFDEQSDAMTDYAQIWGDADKVVFSSTLPRVDTENTWLERTFDPAQVVRLKEQADRDLSVGGPGLAAAALRAGLVDEVHLLLSPVVVGGGTAALPDGLRLDLELRDERRFGNGVAYLGYRVEGPGRP